MSSDANPKPQRDAESDGRVLRGARNREVIVDALLELVRGGEIQPTAEQVARRAGVGTRTVFRHFDDMESLYAEMDARVTAENMPFEQPKSDAPRNERVAQLVRERSRVFERITPFKRASSVHRSRSRFLQERHHEMNRTLRAQLLVVLAEELGDAPEGVADAIDLLTSFEAWDRLRSDQRLGRERAIRIVEQGVHALLDGFAKTQSELG